MNKITKKFLFIILIILLIQIIFNLNCQAMSSIDDIISTGDRFLQNGKDSSEKDVDGSINYDKAKKDTDQIYNILFTIGVCVAVGTGMILGIKYMTGSISEQADIKEKLIPYILGCVIIFGAFGIWKLIISILGLLN